MAGCLQLPDLRGGMGLMTQHELAQLLGVTVGTLRDWRRMSRGPDYVRLEKSIYYRLSDLESWMTMHVVEVNRRDPVDTSNDNAPVPTG